MKWSLTVALFVGCICWNTNSVKSNHHHHQSDHSDHSVHHSHHDAPKTASKNKIVDFSVRLMEDLHHEAAMDENIIISPISIIIALGAAYKGAAGKTREELGNVLGIQEDEAEKASSTITTALNEILKKKEGLSYTETSLAAGIFVQKDFPVRKEFIHDVHFTNVANVDFSGKAATDEINKFVSDATKGRISPLFPSPLDSQTTLVLVSALYFHGRWKEDFLSVNTKPEKFHTGTKDVHVQMMNAQKFVPYYENPSLKFEAIQIPYHDDYYMSIVLPHKEQTLMNLTHYLTGDDLYQALYHSKTIGVDYKIPRMKFSWKKSLKSVLQQEGLKSAFEKADFSKLTPLNTLTVSDVYHAAEIEVNEEGTKASAVTALQFSTYSLKPTPVNPKQFYANRPFLLTIFHQPTAITFFQAFVHQPNSA